MLQALAAAVLALHGLIHLIGFVVPWRIAAVEGFAYRTTALGGSLQLGDGGARLVGLVWLGLAFGFVIAGLGVLRGERWAGVLTAVLALASVLVCTLGLPETVAGLAVNAAILVVLALTTATARRLSAAS